jgi:hypothetical protein
MSDHRRDLVLRRAQSHTAADSDLCFRHRDYSASATI